MPLSTRSHAASIKQPNRWQRWLKLSYFAVPMVLSNMTTPMLSLFDLAILGHLPLTETVGGVALGAMLFSFLMMLCQFLRVSTSVFVAQATCPERQLDFLAQGALLACAFSVMVLLGKAWLFDLAIAFTNTSSAFIDVASVYFSTRIWAAPAVLMNFVVLGFLLGYKKPKQVLLQVSVVNITNMVLDIVFIWYLDWGVLGAAWASIIAELIGLILGLGLLIRLIERELWQSLCFKINVIYLRQALVLNRDIVLRTLCLQGVLAFMTLQATNYGDAVVAANAILLNLFLFISYVQDGFAYAVEVEVAQRIGRQQAHTIKPMVVDVFYLMLIVALGLSFILWCLQTVITEGMTSIVVVQETLTRHYAWIVWLPITSCLCFLMDGVFIGAALGKAMKYTMLAAVLGSFLPVWYVFQDLENHSLWLAWHAFLLVRGGGLLVCFIRQKYLAQAQPIYA
jgi:multidrug resistance protein, MATE family